ncbi:MAG: histidine--tRNA ligase [Hyphomicrobium sp.]
MPSDPKPSEPISKAKSPASGAKSLAPSGARAETRPEARIAKGFRDIEAGELAGLHQMLSVIRGVYERYGFEALETPALEYTDALGKFLPDSDRPNAGVFSFQDEDEQWMSLRYDLTAPLARYVAQNFDKLPKPYRRYAYGPVYRNEKPGPGRFRQFMQFDADTVGTESIAADAEICMLAADTLEALGLKGKYVIKVNNRKVLDGLMESVGLSGDANASRRLIVLRALDKFDRLGWTGVEALLGVGRTDESGDRTLGAKLGPEQIVCVKEFLQQKIADDVEHTGVVVERPAGLEAMRANLSYQEGIQELVTIKTLCRSAGYEEDRIRIDVSVIRGLEYYTGPVFEAELTFEVKDEDGRPVRFGSVGGGGRYDDLVARFTGQKVPATGFSIGVSRLQAALAHIGAKPPAPLGPVVVLVMDKAEIATYQKMVQSLRNAGIRAEMYLGSAGMNAQMKYANKRNSPCVVIQGSNEREKGEVTLKDLIEGAKAAAAIKDNKEWKEARAGQVTVSDKDLVAEVAKIIARHTV